MIIWSIVIIINSVLTLQVSTASLPHDCEPCEIKVVFNHTCSLHTWVCAGSSRERIRLSGFQRQGISSTPGVLLKCPIPVRVCAEHVFSFWLGKRLFSQDFISFWDNKLQFWPERLHISKKWGQNYKENKQKDNHNKFFSITPFIDHFCLSSVRVEKIVHSPTAPRRSSKEKKASLTLFGYFRKISLMTTMASWTT